MAAYVLLFGSEIAHCSYKPFLPRSLGAAYRENVAVDSTCLVF